MAALDTNVLVRLLVDDDAAQCAAAARLVRNASSRGEALFVPITVSLETEWVLRHRYGYDRGRVTRALSDLLSTTELSFEAESALELALLLSEKTQADFSDCLHVALAVRAGERPLWTFDKAAAKLPDARLLRS